MIDQLKKQIAALQDRMVHWRRHLHAHPELSFQEHATAAYVAEELRAAGIEVRADVGKLTPEARGTGVIGLVRGEAGTSDRCFALRADLDALPITELEGRIYGSKHMGVMHACGHDAHTAMVLGAGLALHQLRSQWSGTVMLVFQPGEEKEPGGATLLLKEEVFQDPAPAGILGHHVTPELAVGKVAFRAGPFMASADEIYMRVVGRGGHASLPHKTIDPVLISAHLITVLQQLVSRRTKPGEPTVLSFGRVIADGATNIIPDEVRIEGTLRTFNEQWRMELHGMIERIARSTVEAMGGELVLEIRKGSPPVVNHPELTRILREAAGEYLGKENVLEAEQRMGAEDFAWYSQVMPACFYRLGTGNPAKPGTTSGLHRSEMDIDEDAMQTGAGLMGWCALRALDPVNTERQAGEHAAG